MRDDPHETHYCNTFMKIIQPAQNDLELGEN